jgi:hypothetical protein
MLEGKALVIAIMMLTAAPIAATDSGQIFIEDVRDNFEDMLANDEPTKVSEIIDDSKLDESDLADRELLATKDSDVPCFTFEEWKELRNRVSSLEKELDDERKESEENDRARGDSKDNQKTDDKKEEYYDREDWADKKTVSSSKYDGCLTVDEWTLKFESDEDKDEPCYTIADIEKKIGDERKSHKNFFGRDKEWDREEKDWDDEWFEELEILAEACKEGDEESCDELLEIREELAEDRDEEERDEEDDGARGGNDDSDEEEDDGEHNHADDEADDHSHDDDEADDHNHVTDRYDENWDEIRAVIQELAEACENGDEDACVELREMIAEMLNDRKEGWNKDWHNDGERDWNEDSCLTMEEWKKIFNDGKDRKEGYDRDDDRKERGPHRDAFVREILEELEYACEEEGDEEACAELEEMIAEFEEREGDCDKERDDEEDEANEEEDESDEDDEWDENDEDESDDEDDSNEE